LVLTQMLLF